MATPPRTPSPVDRFLALIGARRAALPRQVPGQDAPPLLHVADLAQLPCWLAETDSARTRTLARRLARHGHVALLLGRGGHPDGVEAAVTLAPARVHAIDLGAPAIAVQRLRQLAPTGSRLGDALAAAAALDVDAAGRLAFGRARARVTSMVRALPERIPAPDRHAWVLLQVTRLLFLRFVESEGWLDGRADFLARAVDDVMQRGGEPWTDLLAPLFFGTLNRPVARRTAGARRFGRIPFLNGGLFERHPLEVAHRHWPVPITEWHELLGALVEQIEVSLDEGGPGGAVTPDMLGRILEGLMDPEERSSHGVFYTPPRLVDRLVRTALESHLARRTGTPVDRLHEMMVTDTPSVRRLFGSLRILDPAVGSGAFLIGVLRALAPGPLADQRHVRHLLTHCLHGVDRQPAAVRITELRLWLALLRSMRGLPPERVRPLPNLDTAVRAGDALLDPLAGLRVPDPSLARLREARAAVARAHGAAHRRAVRGLRLAEHRALAQALAERESVLRHDLADRRDAASTPGMFGDPLPPTAAHVRGDGMLQARLDAVAERRAQLRREGPGATFAIEAAWAPVLAAGGFDLVVGNPPWVRAERLPTAERDALAGRYRWWRGVGPGWRHAPDLAVAFVERAVELVRPGGTIAFLVPAKLATAGYGTTMRAALVRETTLEVVADLQHDPGAVFAATTYPLALITSRRPPPAGHRVRTTLDGPDDAAIPQAAWDGEHAWLLQRPEVVRLVRRLRAAHPILSDRVEPALGVKTGANAIFLDPPDAVRAWTRPALRGRDVRQHADAPRQRLLWTHGADGRPLAKLPAPVAAYLRPHETALRRRADQQQGPWWQLFRTGPAQARWRVVWPDIARELRAVALDDPDVVPLNSCYVAVAPTRSAMHRLAAWLTTPTLCALARLAADPAAGGHARFAARTVGALPCPAGIWTDPTFGAIASHRDAAAAEAWAVEVLGLSVEERNALAAVTPHRR